MRNIIIRFKIGKSGDVTFLTDRAEYIGLMKENAPIIFAIEYPSEEIAAREVIRW